MPEKSELLERLECEVQTIEQEGGEAAAGGYSQSQFLCGGGFTPCPFNPPASLQWLWKKLAANHHLGTTSYGRQAHNLRYS
jgi:hypothetical protein